MAAARNRDYMANMVLLAIGNWMGYFAPNRPKPVCAECTTTIESPTGSNAPEAFYIAIPTQGDGDTIVAPVCGPCTRKIGSESLLAKAIEHFKKLWPEATVTRAVQ